MIGLGVYLSEPGAETYNAVLSALKMGYRHIDTAEIYGNEVDVGRAIRDTNIPREEIVVTTKLFTENWGYDKAHAAGLASNAELGLGYIDLYLLHAPGSKQLRADTWRALGDLQATGVVKDIGVSNFNEAHLETLLTAARVKPAVNQVELHPWMMRPSLVKFCQELGITMEAYSPLARCTRLDDPTLVEIADELGCTPAQALVSFGIANGFVTLPKSVRPERQKTNLESADFKMSTDQVARLASPESYYVSAGWDPAKEQAGRLNCSLPRQPAASSASRSICLNVDTLLLPGQ